MSDFVQHFIKNIQKIQKFQKSQKIQKTLSKAKDSFARELADSETRPRYNLLLLGCVFSFLLALFSFPMPTDDLYRHVVSYLYGYDYRQLYPFMDFPSWNYWIGFEKALAWLQGPPLLLSRMTTVRVVQMTALLLTYLVFGLSLWRILNKRPDAQYWVILFFVLVFPLFAYRAVANGRPEIFATLWMMSALLVSPFIWVAIGALLSPIYGLIPIYAVGAAFLNTSLRKKVFSFVLVVFLQIGFWMWYTDFRWPELFGYLSRWVEGRSLPVMENASLLIVMLFQLRGIAAVGLLALVMGAFRPSWKEFDRTFLPVFFVVIFFAAPNMSRYMPVVLFGLAVLTALALGRKPQLLPLKSWAIRVVLFVDLAFSGQIKAAAVAPTFSLPAGSRVFAIDGPGSLALPFYSPERIQVIPSMEHGGNVPAIKEALAQAAKKGTINCALLHELKITHVAEKSLKGEPPPCLDLTRTDRHWRLWTVR